MTDREHRIDTGKSDFAIVKEAYPQANQLQVESRWNIFSDYTETRSIGKGATSEEAWADAAARLEDQMTASDHLKHRTGSLGGDQIPELAELKTKLLDIANNCDWFDSPCARQIRTVLESSRIKTLIERIAKAESALAQKTRECEELFGDAKAYSDAAKMWRETSESLKAQVEQLGRQVAEMSKPVTDKEWEDARKNFVRKGNGFRDMTDYVLASRARTK